MEIADAAGRLFSLRGFEAVTVDEVARAAGVSKQTVFNYFPGKEDLVFSRAPEQREAMLSAVRERPSGTSVVDAIREYTRDFWTQVSLLADERPQSEFWTVLAGSPALLAHGRELNTVNVAALAELIHAEARTTACDLRPSVAAHALVAPHTAVFDHALPRMMAGEQLRDFVEELLEFADSAYELLETGLAGYPGQLR